MRILITGKRADARSALGFFLRNKPNLDVVAETADFQTLLARAETTKPEVILLDWELCDLPLEQLLPEMQLLEPQPGIILINASPESQPAALEAGVDAIILRGETAKSLWIAIESLRLERERNLIFMNNDLIVMTFDNQQDALKARGALDIMRNSPFLGATNALPLFRDHAGKLVVQIEQLPQDQTGPDNIIPIQLANIIFGESEDQLHQMVAAGLNEEFFQVVQTALIPGGSLILIYVPYEGLVDTQQVLEALKLFDGRLYLTTITPQVEQVILEAARKETK